MEQTDTMNGQQARDYWQAHNLIARTLAPDPNAKVLVHCGYSHLEEVARPSWTPMAYYFREATGLGVCRICRASGNSDGVLGRLGMGRNAPPARKAGFVALDPLTVDQTMLAEKSIEEPEHSWRLDAEARGLVGSRPVVLVHSNGEPLRVGRDDVDIRILNPRTEYANDRPTWMHMDSRRVAVSVATPECAEQGCVVEAFDVVWDERAVPYDRVESAAAIVDMYLPPDNRVVLHGHRLDGSQAFRRVTSTPTSAH